MVSKKTLTWEFFSDPNFLTKILLLMFTKLLTQTTRTMGIVTLLLLFCSGELYAQTPTYSYAPTSYSTNVFPLGNASSNQCQWLFQPSDFSSLPTGAVNISTIYIRTGNAYTSGSFSNITIKMGTTSSSCLTSGTWNSGLTTVYYSSSVTVGAWTNGGWFQVPLQTPFYFNGTSNFILEISQTSFSNPMYVHQGNISGCNRRMYGSASNTSSTGADGSLVAFGFDATPAACSGTPSTPSISNAPYSPTAPLCAGSTTTLNGVNPNFGTGLSVQWQVSSGGSGGPWANVTNGSGATTTTYTTGAVMSPTYYRMGVTCANSNLTSYSSPYYVLTGAPIPSTITGPALYCPGDTATYAVAYVPGTSYTWSLPTGWSGTSTSNSILATPGLSGGTISVFATSSCGVSVPQSRVISLGSPPAVPTPIQGSAYVCSGTSQTYTVTPVAGAKYYTWTLPSGWTGTSTTNSITTTVNSTSGTVSVIGTNGCGSSSSPRTLYVNVISSLPNPGTITGNDTVCSGSLQTYKIVPVPGATSYTWSYPNGWSGTTTDTLVQVFPGTNSGNIQVVANAPCAYSPISSKAINSITTVTPSVLVGSSSGVLCSGIPIMFTATPTNGGANATYQWQKNGTNIPYTGATYTDNLLKTGDTISVVMTSSLRCTSAATVKSNSYVVTVIQSVTPGVNINTLPITAICEGESLTFSTTSTSPGSAPLYQWYKNGFPIAGATGTSYTTPSLANKDTITIGLTSNAACATSNSVMSNKVGVSVTDTVVPTISVTASTTNIKLGELVTFTASYTDGGTTPAVQWMKNGMKLLGENGDTYTSTTITDGDHISATLYSYHPCPRPRLVSSNEIVMEPPLGVKNAQGWLSNMHVYPNPSNGKLSLRLNIGANHIGSTIRIEVMNTVGQVVYIQELKADKTNINATIQLPTSLANGSYMLRLLADDARAAAPFVLSR